MRNGILLSIFMAMCLAACGGGGGGSGGAARTSSPAPLQVLSVVAFGPSDPVTNPKYFVVDATNVYWLQGGSMGSIYWRPLNGGASSRLTVFTSLNDPVGLAVDSVNAYWTEQGSSTGTGTVMSAPLAGATSPYVVLASGLNNPQSVVVSAGYVYFSEFGSWDSSASLRRADGTIKRVPVAGGPVQTLAANLNGPQSMQVDATRVYWVEVGNYLAGASSVKSVPVAGGSATSLVSGLTGSQYIAIDAANVYYWSSYGTLSGVPLGGATSGNPIVQWASGISGTLPLAADASSIYWTEAANGGVLKRLTKANRNVTALTSGFSRPDWISVDATHVYWMQDDSWNGTSWDGVGAIFRTAK